MPFLWWLSVKWPFQNLSYLQLGDGPGANVFIVFRIRDFESASLEVSHKSTSFNGPAGEPFQIEVNGILLIDQNFGYWKN